MLNKASQALLTLPVISLILLGLFLTPGVVQAKPIELTPGSDPGTANLYLPAIGTYFLKQAPTPFGVEMGPIVDSSGLKEMEQAGTYWVRRSEVNWALVQPSEGTPPDWTVLQNLESELITAHEKGLQVILIVLGTPDWAQAEPGHSCSAVRQDKLPAFASFMNALVSRYSADPYDVKYWELWNEPDISPSLVATDSEFGCWGNEGDTYYGGGRYADMLQAAYPQVKAADPEAQVLVGGLLLDCNPNLDGACAGTAQKKPPLFFEGILRHNGFNDGGNYFDGVSYHAYDFYQFSLGQYMNSGWETSWNSGGPAGIAKAEFLKSLLDNPIFGASGKYLMNTEAALLCSSSTAVTLTPGCESDDSSAYEITKAYYVAESYASSQALGLRANVWYSVKGWRNSGLLNGDLSPRLAYKAYSVAWGELVGSTFQRNIDPYPSITGYEFLRGSVRVWVIWSGDGAAHTITLDKSPLVVMDALGNKISTSPFLQLQVDVKPVYIEFSK